MKRDTPEGWERCRLGDQLTVRHGYAFKSTGFVDLADDLPIIVKPGMFREDGGFNMDYGRIQCFDGNVPPGFTLAPRSLLMVMTCQTQGGEILGVAGSIPDDGRAYLHNQRIGRIECRTGLDRSFAYWLLNDWGVRRQLLQSATGSTVLHTSPTKIQECVVRLPPLSEQHRIVSVLGALDDKIASNRRLANVLHETNDAQFWHQFGDLAPGSDGDGKWPVGFLGDLVDVTMGQSPPGSTYTSDPTAGVLLVQGMGGMGNRFPTSQTYTSTPTKHAKAGATLMTVRAPVGAVNVAHVDLCLGRGVAGITSTRPAFTEYMIRSLSGRWAPEESGTIFPAVNKKQITGLTVALPPNSEADAFETFASPFVGKLAALDDETSTLTQILGELLPKLISGEIRVPAGEPDPEALAA